MAPGAIVFLDEKPRVKRGERGRLTTENSERG
jgi:hypothetical protein